MTMRLKAGEEIIDAIILAYRANQPVLLEGTHGVGKSMLFEEAATKLGVECRVFDLSLMEPPDLIGLPSRDAKTGRTVYAPPATLPDKGRGLLVFEELNRCEKYMRAPCLQLLTARRLNDYRLPEGWLPNAAINPDGEDYEVQELDPALLSRFACIGIVADVKAWLGWGDGKMIHPAVLRYVDQTGDIFESSNPRAWGYVSNTLQAYEAGGSTDRALLAIITGVVGDTHAAQFMHQYQGTKGVTSTRDILRNYADFRDDVRRWAHDNEVKELGKITHLVRVDLQGSDLCTEIAANEDLKENLKAFIGDLPKAIGNQVQRAAKIGGAL